MEFYPTQYELLQSRGLAERVVKSLDLMEDPAFNPGAARRGERTCANAEGDDAVLGSLADQIRGGLAVEPVRNTQLVQLSFRAASPEFAARAANAFAEAYIDMGVEDRYATAGKASTFLSSQIEKLKLEIQDKETQLQAFSRRSDIVTMDPAANVTLKRLEALNGQYMRRQEGAHRARGPVPRDPQRPPGVDVRQPVERRGERPARAAPQARAGLRDQAQDLQARFPRHGGAQVRDREGPPAPATRSSASRWTRRRTTPWPPTRRRCARSRSSTRSSTSSRARRSTRTRRRSSTPISRSRSRPAATCSTS